MKKFRNLHEDVVQNPAQTPADSQDIFSDPSIRFLTFEEALKAAKNMMKQHIGPTDRIYIMTNRKGFTTNINLESPYVVVFNKTLISRAPDWQQRGYIILAWVSAKDNVVIRTKKGKYIKVSDNKKEEVPNEQ